MKPTTGHEVLLSATCLAVADVEGQDEGHCDIQLPSGIKVMNVPTSDILDSRPVAEVGDEKEEQDEEDQGQKKDQQTQEEVKNEVAQQTPAEMP